ncbi:MAG: SH3 domain-containing protein [Deltaproteobacteria bacterium]
MYKNKLHFKINFLFFFVVFVFIQKSHTQNGPENILLTAYVQDPDKENPTNIRKDPGGEILISLKKSGEYMVEIIGQKNAWFKINKIQVFDTEAVDIPGKTAWMHFSVLAVRTRNYADQSLNVYSLPNMKSKITAVIKEETEVRFKKINNDYVLIRFTDSKGKNVEGWIKKDWLCGNPVTNCN